MTLRKQVKYNAKRCLCNNWGKAISIVLLNTAVYLLFAIIEMMIAQLLELPIGDSTILMSVSGAHTLSFILSLLMSIGSFLLMVPLNLGIMRWYHSLSDGVSEDIMGIFSCFANRKMFFRSLWLSLNTGVRIALTAVLYLFLPTVGFVLSSFLLSSHLSEALFLGSLSLDFFGSPVFADGRIFPDADPAVFSCQILPAGWGDHRSASHPLLGTRHPRHLR